MLTRRILIVIATLIIASLLLWPSFARHHTFVNGHTSLRYDESLNSPGTVSFHVRNPSGQPIAGVPVNTYSSSGWAAGTITDSHGYATLFPGEWEILAVRVNDDEIRFWPSPLDLIAGPDTGNGVRFTVEIMK